MSIFSIETLEATYKRDGYYGKGLMSNYLHFLPKKSDIKTDSVDSVDSDVKSISKILDGLVCRGLSGRMRLFLA